MSTRFESVGKSIWKAIGQSYDEHGREGIGRRIGIIRNDGDIADLLNFGIDSIPSSDRKKSYTFFNHRKRLLGSKILITADSRSETISVKLEED